MTTLDEMWAALEAHQPIADKKGYGEAWKRMCTERTEKAAADAYVAAAADADAAAAAAADATRAAADAAFWVRAAIDSITRANEGAAK